MKLTHTTAVCQGLFLIDEIQSYKDIVNEKDFLVSRS